MATRKGKPSPEDFIEALLDSRVVDALAKALSPFIALSIDEALGKKLDGLTSAVRDLKQDNIRLAKQCETLAAENVNLNKLVSVQSQRIDDLECYSRSENLIIRGLPEGSAAERASNAPSLDDNSTLLDGPQSVEDTVREFCKDALGIDVSQQDISVAHRLKKGPKDAVRPIIVRFARRQIRNRVFGAKKQLKNYGGRVFISEHLTKTASDLFFQARKLLKDKRIYATWTQNGQVHVKHSADQNSRSKVIKCIADLNSYP
jgi:hypothetical protein